MKVAMRHPWNGKVKEIPVGWSWTIFLFSFFFGIPLFLKGLTAWGFVMAGLLALIGYFSDMTILPTFLFLIDIALIFHLAATGNEKVAKNYLEHGYTFLDPETDAVKYAKEKWHLP